ncbi:uncharacterized protein BDW47DRAFT_110388 [Aspergillus candidus]|uniref:DUF4211 domain-containing protein n=1 Tax=Aspergillus candidus TaxID=41067 RepID=A0A2I2F4A8_ASPCN|nr:hypothetical protein BDW47DRAFT_110388 [Aspergillus candidus]PLB35470.1 hypothetical protein BDW47DRAFT_110388 [Aspergillus candidus]
MPRTYGKAKQTRLSFAPVASPPQDSQETADGTDRRATLRYGHPSTATLRRERPRVSPSPIAETKSAEDTMKPGREKKTKDKKDKKEKRERKRARKEKKGKKKKDKQSPQVEGSDDLPAPDPNMRTAKEEEVVEANSSVPSEQEERRSKRKRSPTPDAPEPSSATPPSPAVMEDSDADEIVTRPRRKLRRGPAPVSTIVLDDSEDEPVVSPAKRRRVSAPAEPPQTPPQNQNQDMLDIEEDLADLQDSVVKKTRTRGRLANSAKSQRQLHLETLRRRRAGQREDDIEESADQEEDEESEQEDDQPESEASSETSGTKKPRLRITHEDSDVESAIASNDDLDRYEDDFVLEDEDDKLGVPTTHEDMPLEFSRHAYKQLKDYFQDAVEWMVHNKLNPAFPRSDPLYKVAFDKLESEVKGRTGSTLVSSVWNAEFRYALLARPYIEVTSYPTSEHHPCDACKRSGHPASSDIKLYGKAYSLETLEALTDQDSSDEGQLSQQEEEQEEEEEEEEEEVEDDGVERDREGHILPDENNRFYLGRHCKNRATIAHTLTHWRFNLNEWVVDHLARMGYLSDEEVVKRSHWSVRKQTKYAAQVFKTMVENDEVKKLWRDFHINLRTARESTTL